MNLKRGAGVKTRRDIGCMWRHEKKIQPLPVFFFCHYDHLDPFLILSVYVLYHPGRVIKDGNNVINDLIGVIIWMFPGIVIFF